jgi:hypothetical protein
MNMANMNTSAPVKPNCIEYAGDQIAISQRINETIIALPPMLLADFFCFSVRLILHLHKAQPLSVARFCSQLAICLGHQPPTALVLLSQI